MKISRTATGVEIVGLTLERLTDGKTYTVRVFLSDSEFRRLVTLGAEFLMAPPECVFMQG